MEDLQAEHISYMIKAFQNIASDNGKEIFDMTKISQILPRLLKYTSGEVYRYNMSDLVTMIDGYHQLWIADVLGKQSLVAMHKLC